MAMGLYLDHAQLFQLCPLQKCAVDEDSFSFKVSSDEANPETVETETEPSLVAANAEAEQLTMDSSADQEEESTMAAATAIAEAPPVFELAKRLSCKWTSGVGPRIGCVRDYPADLQSRALEEVNLSPRDPPSHSRHRFPIPSPRPSPKIRVSPRLSYMGMPSPRVSVVTAT